jgi:hypothetical protein
VPTLNELASVLGLNASEADYFRDWLKNERAVAREQGRQETLGVLKALSGLNGSTDAVLGFVRKATGSWDESQHHRNHGQFSSTTGGGKGDATGTNHGVDDGGLHGGDTHPVHGVAGAVHGEPTSQQVDPDEKATSLAQRIAEVPKALRQRVSEWVNAKYRKLSLRYGEHGAKAILGATVLLLPVPVPGSSLLPVAVAEAILRIRTAIGKAEQPPQHSEGQKFQSGDRWFVIKDGKAVPSSAPGAEQSHQGSSPPHAAEATEHRASVASIGAKLKEGQEITPAEKEQLEEGMKHLTPTEQKQFAKVTGQQPGVAGGGAKGDDKSGKTAPKSHPAAEMPADMMGTVKLSDANTGEVYAADDADAIRQMLRDAREAGEDISTLLVSQDSEHDAAARAAANEEARRKHDEEAARRRTEQDRDPNRPGGRNWVDPPETLWHATYAGATILRDGFKTAEQLGGSSDVLGGTARDSVSFTTRENADNYLKALEVARDVAQGRVDMTDPETARKVGAMFGVGPHEMNRILRDVRPGLGKPKAGFDILQRVSMESRGRFPTFMGSDWTPTVRSAPAPKLIGVHSASAKDLSYNPSEQEWRVHDPHRLKLVS